MGYIRTVGTLMHHPRSVSPHRQLFILLAAFVWLGGWSLGAEARGNTGKARHIILFVGDGMQLEHEIATSRYLYGKAHQLSFHRLDYKTSMATWDVTTYNKYAGILGVPAFEPTRFHHLVGYDPKRGGKKPYPLQKSGISDSYFLARISGTIPASDSAATATAWATGFKTDAGNLAWLSGDPPGGALTTIAELLREQKGYAIGVVSTVPFSDATPAAFVSHNPKRSNYHQIGSEIIRTFQPEVVIGGGFPGTAGFKYISEADYRYLKGDAASPYVFVERETAVDGTMSLLTAAQAAMKQGRKLFGLYGGREGNFESPVSHDFPGTPLVTRATIVDPTLRDATLAALTILSHDPDGFFVMIEQGDIDWANHANDYQRMIGAVWDLHEAVQCAIDYINRPGDDIDWTNTLVIVTADHGTSYMRLNDSRPLAAGDLPTQVAGYPCSYAGEKQCIHYPDGEVTYASADHTNELVMVYAHGASGRPALAPYEGSWYPGSRIIDNTQLHQVMTSAAGIRTHPTLTPAGKKPCPRLKLH
jgi:alkaline phosphatase